MKERGSHQTESSLSVARLITEGLLMEANDWGETISGAVVCLSHSKNSLNFGEISHVEF